MAGDPPYPDSSRSEGSDPESLTAGTPRWVKVFGTIALVVVLLFVTLLFTRGPHRPSRHMHSSDSGGHTSPVQRP